VCLKNIAGDENSRFWVLTERPFSGNNGSYCPKKTRKAGFKRCIFSPVNVFQTHSNPSLGAWMVLYLAENLTINLLISSEWLSIKRRFDED